MMEKKTHENRVWHAFLTVLAVVLFYILSYGPMVAFSSRGWPLFSTDGRFSNAMYELYRPIHWLHRLGDDDDKPMPPVGRVIDKYVCWWLDVMPSYK